MLHAEPPQGRQEKAGQGWMLNLLRSSLTGAGSLKSCFRLYALAFASRSSALDGVSGSGRFRPLSHVPSLRSCLSSRACPSPPFRPRRPLALPPVGSTPAPTLLGDRGWAWNSTSEYVPRGLMRKWQSRIFGGTGTPGLRISTHGRASFDLQSTHYEMHRWC